MLDKEHKRHGEKEIVRRDEREHQSQDRDSDHHVMNPLTHKRKSAFALEDSVTELFHQGIS